MDNPTPPIDQAVPVTLLPCPFCGGEASDVGHIRYSRHLDDVWWEDGSRVTEAFYVNCIKCGAVGRSGVIGGYQTKAEAIAAWNTRTSAPRPVAGEELAVESGANSHVFEHRVMRGEECIAFADEPMASRIAAALQGAADPGGVREAAQFLSDRLDDLEWIDGQLEATLRDFMGHVDPAHYRLKSALTGGQRS